MCRPARAINTPLILSRKTISSNHETKRHVKPVLANRTNTVYHNI
jgi:hypothetical protein